MYETMILNTKHRYLNFFSLFKLLFGMVVIIQSTLLIYNHFSGYNILSSFHDFFLILIARIFAGLLASFLIAYIFLLIIKYLNQWFAWNKKLVKRIMIQLFLTALCSVVISTIVTVIVKKNFPSTQGDFESIANNAMIYTVSNIMLMAILEAWLFFIESKIAKAETEKLKIELSQIMFEVLKSQINPHFMFNSLNVLSGLINVDVAKAQLFIDEFSQIYRYVLETIEQPVVALSKELEFLHSYLFLQQIRCGENLRTSLDINAEHLSMILPPLSLQVLFENAIKHNVLNELNPLYIEIYSEGEYLVIKNNIQPKISVTSTGLGLKNLAKRYALICNLEPTFKIQNSHYIATIPLIRIQ